MKLLLEEMLNLMKISWPASLIQHLCLLWSASLIRRVVPSSACEPYSTFVPSSDLVSSLDDDSEDENPPPPTHLPPDEFL
jgi:hypothetical protein